MEDNSTKYCDNNYIFDTNALKYRKYNYKILTTLKKYSILLTMKRFKKTPVCGGNTQMNGKRKVTIRQVAKQADVSVGTVSNYLNGTATVSKDRAKRIQTAIESLDYIPDMLASSLRRKNSKTIHILTPNLNNGFYTNIISSFMGYAYKADYTIHISGYEYSPEMEKKHLRLLENSKPGTVVIVFNGYNDEAEILRLINRDVHVILADRQNLIRNTSSIRFDNCDVIYEIIRYLKEKGYSSIGLLTELTRLENVRRRRDSFMEAMEFHGYKNPETCVYERESLSLDKLKNGYLYMKEILEERRKEELPQAWIATSDYLAIGLMRAINEKGYHIPDDFGVVGYDNLELSAYVYPKLTTVSQDQKLFGEKLWEAVEHYNRTNETIDILLPQKIVIRESC